MRSEAKLAIVSPDGRHRASLSQRRIQTPAKGRKGGIEGNEAQLSWPPCRLSKTQNQHLCSFV